MKVFDFETMIAIIFSFFIGIIYGAAFVRINKKEHHEHFPDACLGCWNIYLEGIKDANKRRRTRKRKGD